MEELTEVPVLGILRGIPVDSVEPLITNLLDSGLRCIEITMNTEHAAEAIERAKQAAGPAMVVGAGTVLDMDDLKSALAAGAEFIVMPAVNETVTAHCRNNNIPVFPGAFTPTEVKLAYEAGAEMVKLFPAGFFGPDYIKTLKGPYDHIKILACGGVRPDNINKYFDCGADAVAVGSSIFKPSLIDSGDYRTIAADLNELIKRI